MLENRDRIKGLFITHGHEDHIGSLPYLLKKFNVPIYAAKLTIGLIKNKLEEHGLASSAIFHEIRPRQKVTPGCFTVEPIHVNHSIPDSAGLRHRPPGGRGSSTPATSRSTHAAVRRRRDRPPTIAEYGRRVCWRCWQIPPTQSVRASPPLNRPSPNMRRLFAKAVSAASSWQRSPPTSTVCSRSSTWRLSRAARSPSVAQHGLNTEMARELGYLHAPDNVLITIDEINKYPPEKVVLITTGSRASR